MKKIIVAIDGYSSCGKSTIAKALAKYAGYMYVDTGAMYRATALYLMRHQASDNQQIISLLPEVSVRFELQPDGSQHTILNGEDVESKIRTLEVGNMASQVSQIREVRQFLVAQQQAMGTAKGEHPQYADVLADVNDRDYRDTHRAESPLRQAEDAVVVDNSHLTREEQMQVVIDLFNRKAQ